jgi:hypothetical protein
MDSLRATWTDRCLDRIELGRTDGIAEDKAMGLELGLTDGLVEGEELGIESSLDRLELGPRDAWTKSNLDQQMESLGVELGPN